MKEVIADGIPVLVRMKDRVPKTVRVKIKPRKICDMGITRLDKRQKKALENYFVKGMSKRQSGIQAGYSPTNTSSMNKLIARKPIIESLEKAGLTDDRLAEIIEEGTKATHPFKPEQKDFHAIDKFVKEANRIKDNYPATKIQSEQKIINIHLTGEDFKAVKQVEEMREKND